MATSFSEDFSQTSLHEFVLDKPFKTASGLIITRFKVNKNDYEGSTSGIRPNSSNSKEKDLVLGEDSKLRIEFGKVVKDFSLDYEQNIDLAQQAWLQSGSPNSTFVTGSMVYAVAAKLDFKLKDASTRYELTGGPGAKQFTGHSKTFDTLVLSGTQTDPLHFKAFRWNEA